MKHEFGICFGEPEATTFCRALAAAVQPGTFYYAELGCAEGRTFSAVLKHLRHLNVDAFGFAVDQPNGWSFSQGGFDQNLAEFRRGIDYSLHLHGGIPFISQCQNETFNAILIDACHEAECAKADFLAAEPKVKKGGIVVFHDTAEYAQGIDIQPHRNLPIGVRFAISELGLFDKARPGWRLVWDVPGNKERDERGIVVVAKV